MAHELRLYLDEFAAKSEPVTLPAVTARALYVVVGALALRGLADTGTASTLSANSAAAAAARCAISSGSLPASILRWELAAAASEHTLLTGASKSRMVLAAPVQLDAGKAYLLRCDRVDFPAGGEALTHTHQGGGIRCLLAGSIRIETQGHSTTYAPLGAWFEAGPDPVYAAADPRVPSAFARCMVLPAALLGGKSSIRYVHPEDQDKPKSQRYQIFIDEPIGVLQ